jgi:tetratricopeptide (TPR) repeat protein
MTIIPLRAYNREIEGLIDNSQLDEAVAHCRHILATYPKYIASYRLLGKAHLEQQRISDATDIFQRVLSSIPDDFIANVGMSIIREDENNLDAAIWHMELAYEGQPANVAIQDELRRLYGRRDGVQPPKVRLTQGALARMYAKGGLFDQAIAELRSAIAEDPNRTDLQLLLAEMYYQTAQRIDAVEACANIIKKLPYCLIANRILAISLPEGEGSDAVKNYQQTVISLDPYYAFAVPETISSEQVPENAVNIERLDWKSGIQVGEAPAQPTWATSLGISIDKPADDDVPDWLRSAEAPEITPTGEQPAPSVSPFIWDTQEVDKIITDTSKPEGEIPDWMKDAGWQPATGEATMPPDEGKAEEPLIGVPADEDIDKAEIPDWLRGIAPESTAEEPPQTGQAPEADLSTPWLEQHQPGPTDSIIQWLDETKSEGNKPTISQDEDLSATLDEEIPDWLKDLEAPPTPSDQESEPSVLETAAATPAFLQEPFTPEVPDASSTAEEHAGVKEEETLTSGEESVPITDINPPSLVEPSKEEILPSELETVSSFDVPATEESFQADTAEVSSPEILKPEELASEPVDEVPDWLRELAEEQPSSETSSGEPEQQAAEILPIESEPEIQPSDVVEQPPSGKQEPTVEETPISSEPFELGMVEAAEGPQTEMPGATDEPEQITADRIEEQPQPEMIAPAEEAALPEEPILPGKDDSLDWLDELTTGQAESDQGIASTPESSQETPPEWMNLEPTPPAEEAIQTEATPEETYAMPAEEMPDWIKGLGEEPEMPEAGEQPEVETAPEQAKTEVPEEQPEMEAAIEQPKVEPPREQLEAETASEQPEIEAVLEQAEMETAPEQAKTETPEEQPEMGAAIEQPMVETPQEQLEVDKVSEQPEIEAVYEQPVEEKSTEELLEVEAAPEIPELAATEEQSEMKGGPESAEIEAVGEEPGQEVTASEEIAPAEELPAWLLELEEPQAEEEPASAPQETLDWQAEELPAWLQEITESEPSSEVPGIAPLTEAEPTSQLPDETPKPMEATEPAMETNEEGGPEETPEPSSWVPKVEESAQPEALETHEGEVPISKPVEEQQPQESVPVPTETEELTSSPQIIAEQNHKMLAEARASIDQGQPMQAAKTYDGLIRQNYQLDEIIQDLTDAVYRYPVDPEMWVSLGDAHFRKDQLQEALNAYNKAEELAR